MKQFFSSLIIASFFLFMIQSKASAEFFSVSVGLPISYTLDSTKFSDYFDVVTDGNPSGFLLHVKFPLLFGVGYESYTQNLKSDPKSILFKEWQNTNGTVKYKLTTTMYDLFYQLPIPVVNLTFGVGFGNIKFECEKNVSCDSKSGGANQIYVQLGVPILELFDVHASYHKVNGPSIEDTDFSTSGSLLALGASVGF